MATRELVGPALRSAPPPLHLLLTLANLFVPAYVVAALFSRASTLRSRLPNELPGQTMIVLGLVMTAAVLAAHVIASMIRGGGYGIVVSQFAPFINIPAKALILVGVVKVLLAALPRPMLHRMANRVSDA